MQEMNRAKQGILLLLALAIAFTLTGCGGLDIFISRNDGSSGDRNGGYPGPSDREAIKVLGGIKLVLQTAKESYLVGEPVPLKFEITNTGSEAAQLTFPSGERFDFLVKHDGQEIWRWSYGKQFIQVLTQLTLEPGQSITYEIEWPQVDNAGNSVPSGAYEAIALLTATEPLESAPLTVQIQSQSQGQP